MDTLAGALASLGVPGPRKRLWALSYGEVAPKLPGWKDLSQPKSLLWNPPIRRLMAEGAEGTGDTRVKVYLEFWNGRLARIYTRYYHHVSTAEMMRALRAWAGAPDETGWVDWDTLPCALWRKPEMVVQARSFTNPKSGITWVGFIIADPKVHREIRDYKAKSAR